MVLSIFSGLLIASQAHANFDCQYLFTRDGVTDVTPITATSLVTTRDQSRLEKMIANKLQKRPAANLIQVDGLGEFRISEAERLGLEKIADEQVTHMVELALDSEHPNALNDAAVDQVLKSLSTQDSIAMSYVQDNALLTAQETTVLARDMQKIEKRQSMQEIADGISASDQEIAPEVEIVMSLDKLIKVLEENGNKTGFKVRAGNWLTSIPKVGHLLQKPVDSVVTLKDRVLEVQRSMDQAILRLDTNSGVLRKKRDLGIQIKEDLARESYLLHNMIEKLELAISQVQSVDAHAAEKLQGQGRLRVASLLRAKTGLLASIKVLDEAFESGVQRNQQLMLEVDVTKMTAIPITAGSLTMRANEKINQMISARTEAIQTHANEQFRLMARDMQRSAVRAVELSKRSTLDASTLDEVLGVIREIRAYTAKSNILTADMKIKETKDISALLATSFNSPQAQALPQSPSTLLLTNEANELSQSLNSIVQQQEVLQRR